MGAAAQSDEAAALDINLRWRAVTPTLFKNVHALSFYIRGGRGACGETCTPTVIGLFC